MQDLVHFYSYWFYDFFNNADYLSSMEAVEISIRTEDIMIDPVQLRSHLGQDRGSEDPFIGEMIESCISDCQEIIEPRAGYRICPARPPDRDSLHTEQGSFHTGRIIAKMLRDAEAYVFFLATAGPGPERKARELMAKGLYPEGYITDMVGSVIAESVAEIVHRHIRSESAKAGLSCTNRYSPGYCGWDVQEQQRVFELFSGNSFGISLSDSSLMNPVKSVSAIVATGSGVRFSPYSCEICSKEDCFYRNTCRS